MSLLQDSFYFIVSLSSELYNFVLSTASLNKNPPMPHFPSLYISCGDLILDQDPIYIFIGAQDYELVQHDIIIIIS